MLISFSKKKKAMKIYPLVKRCGLREEFFPRNLYGRSVCNGCADRSDDGVAIVVLIGTDDQVENGDARIASAGAARRAFEPA